MSAEEDELKKRIIWVMKKCTERGLMTGIGGNASARLPMAEEIWITPSGVYKPLLEPDDLIKMDLDGNIIEGILKPSIEWYFHTAIYKKRMDVNAVVHTHSPMATGFALAEGKIKPITFEAATMLARVPIIPFKYPGTKEFGETVGESIMGNRVVLVQNHGVIAAGYDLIEAMSAVEILDECCTMLLVARQFGAEEPATIPPDQIELIKKIYKV